MDYIRDILSEIGYNLQDYGKEYRARPIYRNSDNNTVLRIRKENGSWTDFKHSVGGSFEELIKISLNLKSIDEARKFLKNKNVDTSKIASTKPKVKTVRTFPKETLNTMLPIHDYWLDRGVKLSTIKEFDGGVIKEGRMKDRYVFPIFNSQDNLIGLSGRCILENRSDSRPKWKHLGDKSFWRYPLQLNYNIIREKKEVFLVESIGDALSMWDAGVKNIIVIFGLDISLPVLNSLIKIDPQKIYISLNNDAENNSAGNAAAQKLEKKLLKYFDFNQIRVNLPDKNDFGEMSKEEITAWRNKLNG
jgi:DNA primase